VNGAICSGLLLCNEGTLGLVMECCGAA
jgi:hypothetical protein